MKRALIAVTAALILLLCACAPAKEAAASPSPSEPAVSASAEAPSPSASPKASADTSAKPSASAKPSPSASAEPSAAPSASPSPSASTAPSSEPSAEPSKAPEPSAEPSPSEEPLPYSQQTSDTVLHVYGDGAERDYYFTMGELQSIGGYVSDTYFSRGKDPQEASNSFEGIRVSYLLDNVVSLSDSAKKVSFTAGDGYGATFSMSQIRAGYIDETDLSKSLSMILAWSEDGSSYGGSLRLVMGQNVEGEYNRQFWVSNVVSLEVKAG